MKAVVFHGVGDSRLQTGALRSTEVLARTEPITDAIGAYRAFDGAVTS
jgi:hypothetical protein